MAVNKYAEMAERLDSLNERHFKFMSHEGPPTLDEAAALLREADAEKLDWLRKFASQDRRIAELEHQWGESDMAWLAAKRRIAELEAALREIADWHWPAHEYRYGSDEITKIARAALDKRKGE